MSAFNRLEQEFKNLIDDLNGKIQHRLTDAENAAANNSPEALHRALVDVRMMTQRINALVSSVTPPEDDEYSDEEEGWQSSQKCW